MSSDLSLHASLEKLSISPIPASASVLPNSPQLILATCIGQGAAGQVYLGSMNGSPEQFTVKLAPWNAGKRMLLNEASIYKLMQPLHE